MTPKRKAPPSAQPPRMSRGGNPFKDRMGLGAYLEDPASYPSSRVIYHNDSFVAIHDRYPKATIHTLLLPRSTKHNLLHPFEALDDPEFLASVRAETARLRALVAKELQRRLGPESSSDAERQAVLDGDAEPGEGGDLPRGRDWDAEVISGVHAVPSMRHLHVHVLSRDMYSEALRHRKHYNSFNTPFLIDVDDFPLAADDPRRNTKEEAYLKWDMKCWRCGRNFGNQFRKLKEHLKDEYEMWKKI
ncbi:hypothetical protein ACHAPT_003270 [Fusarium lateritium]